MGRLLITEKEKKGILKYYGLIKEDVTNDFKSCLYMGCDMVDINVNGKTINVLDSSSDDRGNWAVTQDGVYLNDLKFDLKTGTYYNTKNNNSSGKYYCNRYAEIVIDDKPMSLVGEFTKNRVADWNKVVDYFYNQCQESAWHNGPGYAAIYNCGKTPNDKGWEEYYSDGTGQYNTTNMETINTNWSWDGQKPVMNKGQKNQTYNINDKDVNFTLMTVNTQKTALNVREQPSMSGKILGKVGKGEQLYAAPSGTEGWSTIWWENEWRYMASRYLTPTT